MIKTTKTGTHSSQTGLDILKIKQYVLKKNIYQNYLIPTEENPRTILAPEMLRFVNNSTFLSGRKFLKDGLNELKIPTLFPFCTLHCLSRYLILLLLDEEQVEMGTELQCKGSKESILWYKQHFERVT